MGMLEWLEDYLRSYKGGILMISHDRYFLDAAATGIIDLENHHIRSFRGGYSRYLETKTNQDKAYQKAYDKQQEHIKKRKSISDATRQASSEAGARPPVTAEPPRASR